jgi:hypothetical protein
VSHKQRPKANIFNRLAHLSAEQWVLLIGLGCFMLFLFLIVFLFFPLLTRHTGPVAMPPLIVELAATRGFVLPPTWTPAPTVAVQPSPTGTEVHDGRQPTPLYTPRPTSLPLASLPLPMAPPRLSVIDLARIMQGESPGDLEAAYMVGWVAKNRLLHPGYGDQYVIVSHGFFGYRADMQPNQEFLQLASRVIRAREDPTGGCLYALSRTDITKLGIHPSRADVTKGDWFFFRTWPLAGR